jgi:hypothetical protein
MLAFLFHPACFPDFLGADIGRSERTCSWSWRSSRRVKYAIDLSDKLIRRIFGWKPYYQSFGAAQTIFQDTRPWSAGPSLSCCRRESAICGSSATCKAKQWECPDAAQSLRKPCRDRECGIRCRPCSRGHIAFSFCLRGPASLPGWHSVVSHDEFNPANECTSLASKRREHSKAIEDEVETAIPRTR